MSHGESEVVAVFKTSCDYVHAGWTIAQSGRWSMLKGGLVVNGSGPAELYFHVHFFHLNFFFTFKFFIL